MYRNKQRLGSASATLHDEERSTVHAAFNANDPGSDFLATQRFMKKKKAQRRLGGSTASLWQLAVQCERELWCGMGKIRGWLPSAGRATSLDDTSGTCQHFLEPPSKESRWRSTRPLITSGKSGEGDLPEVEISNRPTTIRRKR